MSSNIITTHNSETNLEETYVVDFGKVLGAGATSTVYLGYKEEDEAQKVAVKIARPGAAPEQLLLFWQELAIIEEIRKNNEHVPWASKGVSQADPARAIILLEFVDNDTQLLRYSTTQDGNAILPHDLGVETAVQYARLLADMHPKWITTRGDRKATDFRWLPDNSNTLQDKSDSPPKGRLVVLDWNRAGDMRQEDKTLPTQYKRLEVKDFSELQKPQQNKYEIHDSYIHQDIRALGQFWLTFLVGKTISQAAQTEVEKIVPWGLRRILNNCLNSFPGRGYQSAADVASDLEAYQALSLTDLDALDALAREVVEQIKQEITNIPAKIKKSEEALMVADLLERRGESSTLNTLLLRLRQWGEENLNAETNQVAVWVEQIKQNIEHYPSLAFRIANSISALEFHEPVHRLCIRRWQLLAVANMHLSDKGYYDRWSSFTRPLQSCLIELETAISANNADEIIAKIETAQKRLPDIPNSFEKDNALKYIRLIQLEIETRLNILKSKTTPDLKGAGLKAWDELNGQNGPYASDVRSDLPDLDQYLFERARKVAAVEEVEGSATAWQKAFNNLVAAFVGELQNLTKKFASPKLAKPFEDAFEAYGRYRLAQSPLSTLPEEEKAHYSYLERLAQLNDRLHEQDLQQALLVGQGNLPENVQTALADYAFKQAENKQARGWFKDISEALEIAKILYAPAANIDRLQPTQAVMTNSTEPLFEEGKESESVSHSAAPTAPLNKITESATENLEQPLQKYAELKERCAAKLEKIQEIRRAIKYDKDRGGEQLLAWVNERPERERSAAASITPDPIQSLPTPERDQALSSEIENTPLVQERADSLVGSPANEENARFSDGNANQSLEEDPVWKLLDEAQRSEVEIADRGPLAHEDALASYGIRRLLAERTRLFYMQLFELFIENIKQEGKSEDIVNVMGQLGRAFEAYKNARPILTKLQNLNTEKQQLRRISDELEELNRSLVSVNERRRAYKDSKPEGLDQLLEQLQKDGDHLERYKNILKEVGSSQAAITSIIETYTAVGLQALLRLELDTARDCLQQADKLATTSGTESSLQSPRHPSEQVKASTNDTTREFLRSAIGQLESRKLSAERLKAFQQWSLAVQSQQIEGMEKTYKDLVGPYAESENGIWAVWPIAEIYRQHQLIKESCVRRLPADIRKLEDEVPEQKVLTDKLTQLNVWLDGVPVASGPLQKAQTRIEELLTYRETIDKWQEKIPAPTPQPEEALSPSTEPETTFPIQSGPLGSATTPKGWRARLYRRAKSLSQWAKAKFRQLPEHDKEANLRRNKAAQSTERIERQGLHRLIDETDAIIKGEDGALPGSYKNQLLDAVDKYKSVRFASPEEQNDRLAPCFHVAGVTDFTALNLSRVKDRDELTLYLRLQALTFHRVNSQFELRGKEVAYESSR